LVFGKEEVAAVYRDGRVFGVSCLESKPPQFIAIAEGLPPPPTSLSPLIAPKHQTPNTKHKTPISAIAHSGLLGDH
jgi:hypothetical protein